MQRSPSQMTTAMLPQNAHLRRLSRGHRPRQKSIGAPSVMRASQLMISIRSYQCAKWLAGSRQCTHSATRQRCAAARRLLPRRPPCWSRVSFWSPVGATLSNRRTIGAGYSQIAVCAMPPDADLQRSYQRSRAWLRATWGVFAGRGWRRGRRARRATLT
jgi:hypothetical protein